MKIQAPIIETQTTIIICHFLISVPNKSTAIRKNKECVKKIGKLIFPIIFVIVLYLILIVFSEKDKIIAIKHIMKIIKL